MNSLLTEYKGDSGSACAERYFTCAAIEQLLAAADVVVFDMNGLLIDDEPLQFRATSHTLAEFGLQMSEKMWMDYCVGFHASEFIPELFARMGIAFDPSMLPEILKARTACYRSMLKMDISNCMAPGAVQIVKAVSKMRHKSIALATSNCMDEVTIALGSEGLNLLGYFDCIISGDLVAQRKPHPEIYQRVHAYFKQENYLVFEDTETGLAAAHSAGMPCVVVPNRYTRSQNFEAARMVISNLSPDALQLVSKRAL